MLENQIPAMPAARIGVRFGRKGMARFVSHLDMQRLFARALRRAKAPVRFSQGFNPHINMSFASAMAVGLETEGDYMEFQVNEIPDLHALKDRLSLEMPEGLSIISVGILPEKTKKLMAAVKMAEYRLSAGEQDEMLLMALHRIMREDSCFVTTVKKGKEKTIDIRPLIYEVTYEPEILVRLALSGEKSLSPGLFTKELSSRISPNTEISVVRTDLFTGRDGSWLSLERCFI